MQTKEVKWEGIYFTLDSEDFKDQKFRAANRVFANLSGLRDTYDLASKSAYERIWKECQSRSYLPATLRAIVNSSTKTLDFALDELDEYKSKKEFLCAGALFSKLPWWDIWPTDFATPALIDEAKKRAAKFREDLVLDSLKSFGLVETEKLIRILSLCEKPATSGESLIVSDAIGSISDPQTAFELASYWNTSPYFVLWDSKQNIAKIYPSNSVGPDVVSIYEVLELFLKVAK